MDNIPTWVALTISSTVSIAVAILVQLFVVPWQRKKILGESKNGKPVKFTFGDSDGELSKFLFPPMTINTAFVISRTDSSANSSPKRTKRPISHVYDANTLPAINESTELQSLNNQPISTPNQLKPSNGTAPFDYYRVAQWNGSVPKSAMEGNPYKFDPNVVKKAENLIKNARPNNLLLTTSLDNTDLTITSLNFIDEYQNTLNGRNLQNLYVKAEQEKK